MDSEFKLKVEEAAKASGLKVLIWQPKVMLQLISQRGNGPTITIDEGKDVDEQISSNINYLHEWLRDNPLPQKKTPSNLGEMTSPKPCSGCGNKSQYKTSTGIIIQTSKYRKSD